MCRQHYIQTRLVKRANTDARIFIQNWDYINKKFLAMKEQLKKAKEAMKTDKKKVLSKEELSFIMGGRRAVAVLAGSGTSSTSGDTCCVSTCVCKNEM